jgi:fibronectin-binding autotransporter adhesin
LIVGTLSLLDCAVTMGPTGVLSLTGGASSSTDLSTISGGTLNLGAGGTRTFNTHISGNITVNSVITGTATLVKTGMGGLGTTAVNTFSGPTTITEGIVGVSGTYRAT